ncbi:MAG: hypothetical protein LUC34_02290 [Campylobacter sp.]|nr:hypothetical protein [Campylobacter sp.]
MNEPDSRILKFINKMHLLSLCVIDECGLPYPASCFYAFDELNLALIVAASSKTKHIKALKQNNNVAGTIALDTKIVGKIEGLQFRAKMIAADERERNLYFRRFFYAVAMKPEIWSIKLEWIKFTDNTLGFGKKIIWNRA